jgi:ABC-2 type transport system ATP-binding protein
MPHLTGGRPDADSSLVGTEAIRCEGLTKSYGPVRALDGLDLAVPPGSIFGFLGPNGAGKTTCIKVLLGLAHADRGQAWLHGSDVRRDGAASRRDTGYLAQDPSYPSWMTGREVLKFVGELHGSDRTVVRERVEDVLALVGLEDAADRQCGQYSGGMRQRLGIAQSLMGGPRLVILDEPSSSLDPVGRRDVLAILLSLRERGITVFYSTHILGDVERVADRVAIMKSGRVVRQGTVAGLVAGAGNRFRLTVEEPLDGLEAHIRALPFVAAVEHGDADPGRASLLVDVADADAAKRALPRTVVEHDFVLIACEPARSRLEDVFMESISDGG